MKSVQIELPDRLISEIEKLNREPSEVIIEALNKYIDPSYKLMDLETWKFHIENKIQDLQRQLDDHRSQCPNDTSKDFDKDLWQRKSGNKSPLELDKPPAESRSLVQEVVNKSSKNKLDVVEVDLVF